MLATTTFRSEFDLRHAATQEDDAIRIRSKHSDYTSMIEGLHEPLGTEWACDGGPGIGCFVWVTNEGKTFRTIEPNDHSAIHIPLDFDRTASIGVLIEARSKSGTPALTGAPWMVGGASVAALSRRTTR